MGARMIVTFILVSGVICGTFGENFSEKGVEVRERNIRREEIRCNIFYFSLIE